ncbi:MAG: 3-keto-5-aminohexanoate cleavage protein [Pseudomonadota bacterium]
MNKKIIIAVAPTGGWGAGRGNPVTPEAIAEDVIACARAGAGVVHLHARDAGGALTADLSCFNQTVADIKAACDILLEASTGGLSGLSAAERALPAKHPLADMASLNMGSLNFGDHVYCNSLPDVRYWIEQMAAAGVKPSLEIFDTGHMDTALHLIAEGLIAAPCNFSFIFNVHWGMHYHPLLLDYLISKVPADSRWGALFIGSRDFTGHLEAARKGAAVVRVGFEDSATYAGRTASSNAELVDAVRTALADSGIAVAGVHEARSILFGKD